MTITLDQLRRALTQETPVLPRPELDTELLLAAVAAVVGPGHPLEVLLIRRATSASDPWSAHMAFPGGKVETDDESMLVTAARETLEEIGVDLLDSAEYLGGLPIVDVVRGDEGRQRRALQIHPFVFALKRSVEFKANHEVDEVVWVPLDSLLDGSRETTVVHERDGQRFRFPAWDVNGQPVWGLTYRMLRSLLTALEEGSHE